MEKLYELHRAGAYDLLVLDTPPSRNALDFIDAPNRITRLVEGKTLRFLLEGGMKTGRLRPPVRSGQTSLVAWKAVERLARDARSSPTSPSSCSHSTECTTASRSGRPRSASCSATAAPCSCSSRLPSASRSRRRSSSGARLVEEELPFGGVIVNKVHPDDLGDRAAPRPAASAAPGRARPSWSRPDSIPDLAGRVADTFVAYQALAERDRANVRALARRLGPGASTRGAATSTRTSTTSRGSAGSSRAVRPGGRQRRSWSIAPPPTHRTTSRNGLDEVSVGDDPGYDARLAPGPRRLLCPPVRRGGGSTATGAVSCAPFAYPDGEGPFRSASSESISKQAFAATSAVVAPGSSNGGRHLHAVEAAEVEPGQRADVGQRLPAGRAADLRGARPRGERRVDEVDVEREEARPRPRRARALAARTRRDRSQASSS